MASSSGGDEPPRPKTRSGGTDKQVDPEPTLEEILASIRRIIAEDDGPPAEEGSDIQTAPRRAAVTRRGRHARDLSPPSQEVPPARIAAIEPEWVNGVLTVRREVARADLSSDQVASLFIVLRRELIAFADEMENSNNDSRFLRYIRRLISRLPETVPDQVVVFELGHAAGRLEAYAATFAEETTSGFLTEQYRGLIALLRQITAQFPAWRDFKRNAVADELSQNQVEAGFALATKLASAMETQEARVFIDPALPKAIRELVQPIEPPPSPVGPARDLQAADAVASSGNTLRALVLASIAKCNQAGDAFGRGVITGFEKISEDVVVFTANLVYWSAIGGLISLFPQLAWVAPLALAASKLGKKD